MKTLSYIVTLTVLSPIIFSGCAYLKKTSNPIETIRYRKSQDQSSDKLFIFLPGRHSGPRDFDKNGFVRTIAEKKLSADCIAVNAHLGYYAKRILLPRLHEDVIKPANESGYSSIWLVGISMGGLGAILYAQEYPETISGIFLLAPFLGDDKIIEEIIQSGGLREWNPEKSIEESDYQQILWLKLKEYIDHPQKTPTLCLGYGLEDRFAPANKLLADVLPDHQVFTVQGGHDWSSWQKLFDRFLDTIMKR